MLYRNFLYSLLLHSVVIGFLFAKFSIPSQNKYIEYGKIKAHIKINKHNKSQKQTIDKIDKSTEKPKKEVADKKIPEKPTKNTANKSIKKEKQKLSNTEDIFSKATQSKNFESYKIADIKDEDYNNIKQQVEENWIKTPCEFTNEKFVKLKLRIDISCEIVSYVIEDEETKHPSCISSILRAIQQVKKFNLKADKCKKYSKEIIILNFHK